MNAAGDASTQPCGNPTQHEKTVLVLQGGGALGAYQAGAYHAFAEDPGAQTLSAVCEVGKITIGHLINRCLSRSAQAEDYEFSRATINEYGRPVSTMCAAP